MTRSTVRQIVCQAALFVAALAVLYVGTALLPHAPEAATDTDRTVLLGE